MLIVILVSLVVKSDFEDKLEKLQQQGQGSNSDAYINFKNENKMTVFDIPRYKKYGDFVVLGGISCGLYGLSVGLMLMVRSMKDEFGLKF